MIASLQGKIIRADEKYVVVNVGGVGYKVWCIVNSTKVQAAQHNNSEIEFLVHTVVREDALELFGFTEETSLKLFEKLINISGIGPRSALAIVNVGTIESLTEAIGKGDLGYLTNVSGIGKKTAEKIILELRGQISDLSFSNTDNEVVAALRSMGYTERDAQQAAKNTVGSTTQEKIKSALKQVGK